jgi:hypothetical protein
MGNEQSQQRKQPSIHSPETDQYTLSSITKVQDQSAGASPITDDIVQVHSLDRTPTEGDAPSLTNDDEVLQTLRNLPRVTPLIKSSIDSNFQWQDFVLPRRKTQTGTTLDTIDSRPLIDICAEFQTFAMREAKLIATNQDELISRIRNVHVQTQHANQQMVKKSDGLKKVASALRDVERINRNVEASKQSVVLILKQLQELEELLPHHGK